MRVSSLISSFLLCILVCNCSLGQDSSSLGYRITNFPSKFLDRINKKASRIEEKLISKTEKALQRLERHEKRLQRKLAKKDSTAAAELFTKSIEKYRQLRNGVSGKGTGIGGAKQYIPYLDTLKTSLAFLNNSTSSLVTNLASDKLSGTLKSINSVDTRFQYASMARDFMKERRQLLREKLQQFGFVKELQQYNKEVYYYAQQIREYKEALQDPEKLERKALSLLQRLPLFQKFMSEHSELAALLPMPANYGTSLALQGLQTSANVQGMIQQQMQAAGPNAQAMMQQNIQAAHNQLRQWKEKLNELGGMSSDEEVPDFKPRTLKTKSFWERLEYGTNLQNTRSTSFLPVTSDIGLSLGYRINNGVIGLGASYKMGWGKDIRRITITHEGVGLRSYLDWKIKGSFFISGGYEQNYRQRFENIQYLRNPAQWQQSGLLGVSKKYSLNKKLKGDIKILFDFLYKSHSPQTQPVLFRVGYGF